MKFSFPVWSSYIEPTILIWPFFSRSASVGLLFRMLSIVSRTFVCATASTNSAFLLDRSPL